MLRLVPLMFIASAVSLLVLRSPISSSIPVTSPGMLRGWVLMPVLLLGCVVHDEHYEYKR